MKYLLMIYMNPQIWESLSEADQQAVFAGHDQLIKLTTQSGELVRGDALADPSQSAVVRVREGQVAVTDGPYVEAKEFLAGYYIMDCDTRERAIELAAMIPDAGFHMIEVRPVMNEGGSEM
jgi:hypothetical protein